jgi:indolepyruvate ferredoxin oxidoreductase beta subunit
MTSSVRQQILISGVGGQGVLFITRLLAEAAIARGLPVLTCETHGMAQRGGTVVSHLKVGDFHSPLIRAGQADGLLVLKSENVVPHGVFLKPGGWMAVNACGEENLSPWANGFAVDGDQLVRKSGAVKSLNLVLLGFALAVADRMPLSPDRLFCTRSEIEAVLASSFKLKGQQASALRNALRLGYDALI